MKKLILKFRCKINKLFCCYKSSCCSCLRPDDKPKIKVSDKI